ncbi:MAG: hypothetical protein DRP06_00270 [Candidatus Aenigmatarchaeota archaeon]|nr:MAG: hypothetical protein DRP06_00270 [Candidatus Aenigmarchaeota archaeon]
MKDLKNIFKLKCKKPVEDYEVRDIQIKGLSLDEKDMYPVNIYSTFSVNESFDPNLLLPATDSMTDIQRYLKDYEPKSR